MSDQDEQTISVLSNLIGKCRLSDTEGRIRTAAIISVPALVLILIVCAANDRPKAAAIAGCFLLISINLFRYAGRRASRQRRNLAVALGQDEGRYIAEGRQMVQARFGPDMVLIFFHRPRPSTTRRTTRIIFSPQGANLASVLSPHSFLLIDEPDQVLSVRRVFKDIDASRIGEMKDLVHAINGKEMPASTHRRDGFFCRLVVLERDRPTISVEANLMGLSGNNHPAIKLMEMACALVQEA